MFKNKKLDKEKAIKEINSILNKVKFEQLKLYYKILKTIIE